MEDQDLVILENLEREDQDLARDRKQMLQGGRRETQNAEDNKL